MTSLLESGAASQPLGGGQRQPPPRRPPLLYTLVLASLLVAFVSVVYLCALPVAHKTGSPSLLTGFRQQHSSRHKPSPTVLWQQSTTNTSSRRPPVQLPAQLVELGVYQATDFINAAGRVPTYWASRDNTTTNNKSKDTPTPWGPCYSPRRGGGSLDWELLAQKAADNSSTLDYARSSALGGKKHDAEAIDGMCRPGFLIIGAGKCGTSSLYHYLTDHPRVLPARQKQIHYFKYYPNRPLRWYYSFFPTTASFLAAGALMSGEASPGYLPYPSVPHLIEERLPGGMRILVLGRNPLERMWSSYQYNYVTPMKESMQAGRVDHVEKDQPEDYYAQFLFSFEEMVVAELAQLRYCLNPVNGTAVVKARRQWKNKYEWTKLEYARRESWDLPPMADLDGHCYGERSRGGALRRQWADLMKDNPKKVILDRNTHLIQSIIGRSLYVLPLEWWYARMDASQIYFVCTEELSDTTGAPLNKVASFLGLPSYNFSETIQKGAYNVGGHRGYDTEVSWDVIEAEAEPVSSSENAIPLSDDVLQQVQDFVRPYNERLFQLTGRRCEGW